MRPTLLIPVLLVFTVPAGAQSWQEYGDLTGAQQILSSLRVGRRGPRQP